MTLLARENIEGMGGFFFKFGLWVYLGGLMINSYVVSNYHIEYAHIVPIIDFSHFGIHITIIPDIIFKFVTFEVTCKFCNLDIYF